METVLLKVSAMVTGFLRTFGKRRVTLLAMRAADMVVVQPHMDTTHGCCRCHETVGLYPSGQRVLRRYRNIEIVCQHCMTDGERSDAKLAPGAEHEPYQGYPDTAHGEAA
jgi:hypothetical protein